MSIKNVTRETLLGLLSQVRDNLKAGLAPKEQYDLCGFDFAEGPQGPYVPIDPTDLSAFGYSNGINKLSFKGNNRPGAVKYEIWRRSGDEGPWLFHGSTGKQSFTDTPVKPGQYYEYSVTLAPIDKTGCSIYFPVSMRARSCFRELLRFSSGR